MLIPSSGHDTGQEPSALIVEAFATPTFSALVAAASNPNSAPGTGAYQSESCRILASRNSDLAAATSDQNRYAPSLIVAAIPNPECRIWVALVTACIERVTLLFIQEDWNIGFGD